MITAQRVRRAKIVARITTAIAVLSVSALLTAAYSEIDYTGGVLRMPDLYVYLGSVARFWGTHGNIYADEFELSVFRRLSGPEMLAIMPFTLAPPAVSFLLPFAVAFHSSPMLAYIFWQVASLSIFILGLKIACPSRTPLKQLALCVSCSIILFSTAGLHALVLGQTSLMALGLTMMLIPARVSEKRRRSVLSDALILAFSAIKPFYFAVGLIALLTRQRYLSAALGILLASIAAVPVLTTLEPTIASYFELMRIYSSGEMLARYQKIFHVESICTFATAFTGALGETTAFQLSSILCPLGLLAAIICAAIPLLKEKLIPTFDPIHLGIVAYLLFVSYAGIYEDVYLLIPLIGMTNAVGRGRISIPTFTLAAFFAFALMNAPIFLTELNTPALWFARFVTFLGICYLAAKGSIEFTESNTPKH